MGELVYINKFRQYQSASEIAGEIDEAWNEEKHTIIDSMNCSWEEEIFWEFAEDYMYRIGLDEQLTKQVKSML